MSAVNFAKSKLNCDAVKSEHFIADQQAIISTNSASQQSKYANNGTKLNQTQEPVVIKQEFSPASIVKQESSVASVDFQNYQGQKFSDVQKVLKQEQELQKQLYSGSNVAPGWLRVNHNNKVIYIR